MCCIVDLCICSSTAHKPLNRDHSASLCGTQNKVTDSNGQVSFQEAWIEYIDRPKIELPLRHDQVHTCVYCETF